MTYKSSDYVEENEVANTWRIKITEKELNMKKDGIIQGFLSSLTLSDENGTLTQISALLILLLICGTLLATFIRIIPSNLNSNDHQPQEQDDNIVYRYRWVQPLSAALGYTYFLSWSLSFYPQAILNYNRKRTVGLSTDFCLLNVLGFACYSIYNVAFFWSNEVKEQYKERHDGKTNMVQANDVAFAIHALLLSSFTYAQIYYYDSFQENKKLKLEKSELQHDSPEGSHRVVHLMITRVFSIFVVVGSLLYAISILSYNKVLSSTNGKNIQEAFLVDSVIGNYLNWLDLCYALSAVKVIITIFKYIPQACLNCRRKSTHGWTIWMVVLDIYGGILSILQLILDSWNVNDWTGITGNMAKFMLGFVSILFDLIFICQHYVLYKVAHYNEIVGEE